MARQELLATAARQPGQAPCSRARSSTRCTTATLMRRRGWPRRMCSRARGPRRAATARAAAAATTNRRKPGLPEPHSLRMSKRWPLRTWRPWRARWKSGDGRRKGRCHACVRGAAEDGGGPARQCGALPLCCGCLGTSMPSSSMASLHEQGDCRYAQLHTHTHTHTHTLIRIHIHTVPPPSLLHALTLCFSILRCGRSHLSPTVTQRGSSMPIRPQISGVPLHPRAHLLSRLWAVLLLHLCLTTPFAACAAT